MNLDAQGKLAEAEKLHREAYTLRQRKFGDQNPGTLLTLNNLAVNLSHQKRYVEAEKLLRDVSAVRRRVLAQEHPDTLTTINNLAVSLDGQGKQSDTRVLLEGVGGDLSAVCWAPSIPARSPP